jgi:hypothetical protein
MKVCRYNLPGRLVSCFGTSEDNEAPAVLFFHLQSELFSGEKLFYILCCCLLIFFTLLLFFILLNEVEC